ncbi:MAG: hypothetical protein ABR520_00045 [Mycobacteriales bacterium]|nr:hypothetical protein [Frankia sp.]
MARSQDVTDAPPAGGRPRPRTPAPDRSPEFAHLTLSALRGYRKTLADEENRVSYWRRILQARLDMIRSTQRGGIGDVANLRDVMTDARATAGRTALIEIVPVDDIPPLPHLDTLWERHADPSDPGSETELVTSLVSAEQELSAYRAALHRRIAAATGELIARYREDPAACLVALPLPATRAAVGT